MKKEEKRNSSLPTSGTHLGGGILESKDKPGGFKKFNKNKKQKKVLIGSIVGLFLILGGIVLYKTFAFYEEKKEFNVLQGRIPDFKNSIGDINIAAIVNGHLSTEIPTKAEGYLVEDIVCDKGAIGEWDEEKWGIFVSNLTVSGTICTITFDSLTIFQKLTRLIGSDAENIEQLLTNNEDVTKIVNSEEAMRLIGNSSALKNQIKSNANYTYDVAIQFIKSTVLTNDEKKALGLPFVVYSGGTHSFSANNSACAAWNVATIENSGYSKIYISSFSRNTNYFGITVSSSLETCQNGYSAGPITIDISNFKTIYIDVSWGAHQATTVNVGAIYIY